ncbi:MAG: hypothetical protein RJB61_1947 [Actinomycetota bacterium]
MHLTGEVGQPEFLEWPRTLTSAKRATVSAPGPRYSIRRPEIALAITSCWISDVPSKMVWDS